MCLDNTPRSLILIQLSMPQKECSFHEAAKSNYHGICRLVVGSRYSVAPSYFQKQVRQGTRPSQDKEMLDLLLSHLNQGKDIAGQIGGMCSWCRKNRKMWVCKCLKKRNRPKFCGHWYYKQLFSCNKKGPNSGGNYGKSGFGLDWWTGL